MERKTRNNIIAKLRALTWTLPQYKQALIRSRVKTYVGKYKNGNDKFKYKHKCNHCNHMFDRNECQVDHIIPLVDPAIGFPMLHNKEPDFNTWIARWNCKLNGLQILCKPCHKSKTKADREFKKLPKI